jgi:hypothetical protein
VLISSMRRITRFTTYAAVSASAANAATDNRHGEAWQAVGGSPFS